MVMYKVKRESGGTVKILSSFTFFRIDEESGRESWGDIVVFVSNKKQKKKKGENNDD